MLEETLDVVVAESCDKSDRDGSGSKKLVEMVMLVVVHGWSWIPENSWVCPEAREVMPKVERKP